METDYTCQYAPAWIVLQEYAELLTDIDLEITEDDDFDVYSPQASDDLGQIVYDKVVDKTDLDTDKTCELCNALHQEYINWYINR